MIEVINTVILYISIIGAIIFLINKGKKYEGLKYTKSFKKFARWLPYVTVSISFVSMILLLSYSLWNDFSFDRNVKESSTTKGIVSKIDRQINPGGNEPQADTLTYNISYNVNGGQYINKSRIHWYSAFDKNAIVSLDDKVLVRYDINNPEISKIEDERFINNTSIYVIVMCVVGLLITLIILLFNINKRKCIIRERR